MVEVSRKKISSRKTQSIRGAMFTSGVSSSSSSRMRIGISFLQDVVVEQLVDAFFQQQGTRTNTHAEIMIECERWDRHDESGRSRGKGLVDTGCEQADIPGV